MEWIVLDSCHVLKHYDSQLSNGYRYWYERWDTLYHNGIPSGSLTIHAGLHVMIGWDGIARYWGFWGDTWESRGGIFADKIHDGYNVWDSWNLATKQAKPSWDFHTDRAAMGYGKIFYPSGQELLRYSNEYYCCPLPDPTYYLKQGYVVGRGYSSWNV